MKIMTKFFIALSFLICGLTNANELKNELEFDDGFSLNSQSFIKKQMAINDDKDNDPYEKQCIKPINLGYDEVDCIKQGLAVVKKNGKYGYVNKNGKLVVKPKYDRATNIFADYQWGAVELNNKTGLIDKRGGLIVPIIYDEFVEVDDKTLSAIYNGKYGIIDRNNNIIVPFEYEYATNFMQNGLALLKKNGKYGVMDKNNAIVIPFEYDTIYKISVEKWTHILVEKNKKYGVVDLKGNVIIPLDYDATTTGFMSGLLGVKKGNKWGFINKNNEVVLDFVYDGVFMWGFVNGVASVEQNNERFYIDINGNRIGDTKIKELLGDDEW